MAGPIQAGDGARRGDRWRTGVWGGATALLLAPWVAMQFTDAVAWSRTDFAIFAVMLIGGVAAWELVVRMTGGRAHRAAAGLVIMAAFVLTWLELAVGIFGPG
jgi:hypothetical protein